MSDSSGEPAVVYRGDVVIASFDPDDLADIDALLEDVTAVEPGERLYVSPHGEDGIEVAKLRKDTAAE